MCLEHVDSLDGVLFLALRVHGGDGQHGVDSHWRKEIIVAGYKGQRSMIIPESCDVRGKDLGAHRCLCDVDQAVLAELVYLG
jgi:hypothetical protein